MRRLLLPALAALLALQLLITAAVYWPEGRNDEALATALVPASVAERGTRLRVTGNSGDSVELVLHGDGWRLAAGDLPVAPGRVQDLLDALGAAPGWPVARSTAAQERFEVAANGFERRIELLEGEENLATVYLGTAPGFRRVHARAASGEAIYSLAFNAHDAPAEASGWLDQSLAAVSGATTLRWSGLVLRHGEQGWTAEGGETVDAEAAAALERALEGLQVTGLATPAAAARAAAAGGGETLLVTTGDGEQELRLVEDGEQRLLYASTRERWFTLSRYDHDRLLDALHALL